MHLSVSTFILLYLGLHIVSQYICVSTECVQLFSTNNMVFMIVANKWQVCPAATGLSGRQMDNHIHIHVLGVHACSIWPTDLLYSCTFICLFLQKIQPVDWDTAHKFNSFLSSFVLILHTLHHTCFLSSCIDFISLGYI